MSAAAANYPVVDLEELQRTKVYNGQPLVWVPHPKQAKALGSPAFELFFGGARGGGKSDFLIGDFGAGAAKYGKNWHGILFRRTYTELDEIIKRAKEIYIPLGAEYQKQEKTFIFPNGATLKMRYLEYEQDVERYQGHQYTWIGFDELGNYASDFCWIYMMSCCRSAAGVPCYIRGTGNPGGKGHNWLKNRFIDGFEPFTVYKIYDGDRYVTRVFIPSTLDDNPSLMVNDPNYEARLKNLPENLYRAYRFGDWDVFAGQAFDEFRRDKHVIKPRALPQDAWYKFYAFDWGYLKPFALVKYAVNGDGKVIQYGEIYGCEEGAVNKGIKMPSREAAEGAWGHAIAEGVTDIIMDPACWGKSDDNLSVAENFQGVGFNCYRANNERVIGWQAMHQYLKTEGENGEPMLQIFDTCTHTIRTLPVLTPDPHHPEDIDSTLEDHLADAQRYGIMSDHCRHPARINKLAAAGANAKTYSVMDNW
jgi:hypothetical protein